MLEFFSRVRQVLFKKKSKLRFPSVGKMFCKHLFCSHAKVKKKKTLLLSFWLAYRKAPILFVGQNELAGKNLFHTQTNNNKNNNNNNSKFRGSVLLYRLKLNYQTLVFISDYLTTYAHELKQNCSLFLHKWNSVNFPHFNCHLRFVMVQ